MMADNTKILSSRRSYEYRQDELRLTFLATPAVQQYISQAFNFQMVQVGTPMQTFGSVPATLPPGVVFNLGTVLFPEGMATPIRFLHLEPRRVVIDVAGPSSVIDAIFAQLTGMLATIPTPDGSSVMGHPERVRDYSEITRPASYLPHVLLAPPLRDIIKNASGASDDAGTLLVPSVRALMLESDDEYPGSATVPTDLRHFVYELRHTTHPQDRVYFSAAPLNTNAHLEYLDRLQAAIGDLAD